jgi:diguanylate cyclase (GGDEF)-like protein
MKSNNGKRMGVSRIVASAALAFVVSVLLATQLVHGIKSADRTVGTYLEQRDGALHIDEVMEGKPAARAGLHAGDVIVELDGNPIGDDYDYDRVAQSFVKSRPVSIRVLRDGVAMVFTMVPGVDYDWLYFIAIAVAVVLHLALAILILASQLRGAQARLLPVLLAAIAIELALPLMIVGYPELWPYLLVTFWVLTGVQFSVELHLVSLLPQRHPWAERHRWLIPLYYLVGLGFGLVLAASEVPALALYPFFAWFYTSGGHLAIHIWSIAWPAAVVGILAWAAFRWSTALGRHQALLVLMGVLPWMILSIALTVRDMSNLPMPYWMDLAQPLALVVFPLTILIALYRYRLFNFQLVVRRGAVYATLTTALVLVFYSALGAAGAILSTFVEDPDDSVWVIAAATLILGLLFGPLRKLVETIIERQFFPEREALRRRLGDLAHELPRLGKLPAICDALVANLTDIFAVEWTTLLLVEGQSGLLVDRASSRAEAIGADSKPPLLSANDPFVDALRIANRSLGLDEWSSRSQVARRFLEMEVAQVHPIVADSDLLGLLLLGEKRGGPEFSSEEVELLDLVSRHVATVLENATLFASATLDGLTGLLRREPLIAKLDNELERAIRYDRPLTVGLVDIDQFKEINDRLGHLTGDVMLQRVALRFAQTLRKTDILGRYGGDEFMIILPETGLEGAVKVADQLRAETEELEVETEDGEILSVTICIGLVSVLDHFTEVSPSRRDVIRVADRQLYNAKKSGRNRVVAVGLPPR